MSNPPLQVVCALIVHDGRLLATRRDPSRAFPLMWEFPGGKLENGESAEAALHRELEEELALKVVVVKSLEPVLYRENGHCLDLHPYVCEPAQVHGPVPVDHVEIRWIRAEEASQLTWAPADIPLLEMLPGLLVASRD